MMTKPRVITIQTTYDDEGITWVTQVSAAEIPVSMLLSAITRPPVPYKYIFPNVSV